MAEISSIRTMFGCLQALRLGRGLPGFIRTFLIMGLPQDVQETILKQLDHNSETISILW